MAGIWSRFYGSAVSTAVGFGIGTALGPPLAPLTQAAQNEAWKLYPDRPLSAELAAALVAEGKLEAEAGAGEAALTGMNGDRFGRMVTALEQPPQTGELLDLWRRGRADRGEVEAALRAQRLPARWVPKVLALREVLPPVTDLIRMAVREVFSPASRQQLDLDADFPESLLEPAAAIGLSEQTTRNYWAAHWQLPSREEGAAMLYRGLLSPDEFDGLLKALDYAPTWRGKLRGISRPIPSLSDMIRFAVREVYSPEQVAALGLDSDFPQEFADEAALHGLEPERARQYWAAHWRLPSAQQGYEMLHRGELTEAGLAGLLRALDYPPRWRRSLEAIAYRLPGRVDLRRMYRYRVLSRAEVKAGYQRLGYTAADAETLTRFAEAERAGEAGTKDLTLAHFAAEYLGGYLTEADYRRELGRLGYDDSEAEQIVRLYDARKVAQARDRAASRIGSSFIGWKISSDEAAAALQKLEIRPEAQARMLEEWTVAREANVQQMTAANVRTAFRKGLYDRPAALAELAERGWRPDDAEKYLDS